MMYPAIIEDASKYDEKDTGFVATFRDADNGIFGVTEGETFGEVVANLQDILQSVKEHYDELGQQMPESCEPEHGDVMISL